MPIGKVTEVVQSWTTTQTRVSFLVQEDSHTKHFEKFICRVSENHFKHDLAQKPMASTLCLWGFPSSFSLAPLACLRHYQSATISSVAWFVVLRVHLEQRGWVRRQVQTALPTMASLTTPVDTLIPTRIRSLISQIKLHLELSVRLSELPVNVHKFVLATI